MQFSLIYNLPKLCLYVFALAQVKKDKEYLSSEHSLMIILTQYNYL